ncbi:alpha/beta hydrolase [Rubricoccus marinus]|uniref:Serine aminopeptidase S33 domain-containing protein n=1 Tax=Rubricoccus marinus TaxID=716817 RepID=A0A259TW17_9BACT|nr:alpha/beta fold hydrolase [Rubricoccus marinus]OZC01774.1 hypothetical protein BSZ36_01480 [Rubricoccus marinus]
MRTAVCLAALLVASGCVSVDITERGFFPARRAGTDREAVPGTVAAAFPGVTYEEQRIEAADGTALYGALIRQPGADVTVLYFGTNESTVEQDGIETTRAFLPLGANVFLVDYRGYGWSDGRATLDLAFSDALAAYDHLAALPGVGRVVVHGLSLGSFMAGHVGARRPAAGVVLEGSATTVKEWANSRTPFYYKPFVRFRVEESLRGVDNRAEVRQIEEPLLLLVGSEDHTTPQVLSRRLYAASPLPESRKTLAVIEGGDHGNVIGQPTFAGVYRAFLDGVRAER